MLIIIKYDLYNTMYVTIKCIGGFIENVRDFYFWRTQEPKDFAPHTP